MIQWWQGLSVSKKLYAVVGVMALLIASELFSLYFAMTTLSAVRAFVGGEGLWSKAQKTAVYHLQKYAITRDEKYYQLFLAQLKVPMGDHEARIELEKPVYDFKIIENGFLAGQNHPQDIEPMVKLVRRFYKVPHLARAIERWRQGDERITQLIDASALLQKTVRESSRNDSTQIDLIMGRIFRLDDELTQIENQFSFALGEASRWLESLLMITLLLAVITVEGTGLFLTITFAKGLTRVLTELNEAAILVGEGDFSKRVPIRSSDELGQLASSLNAMTANLQRQITERQSAEQASETKNLFLANMSHEIRTPLNAILGFSEILSDEKLTAAERAEYAAIVKRTGSSLTSIINDILDVSKVEADQLVIELKTFSLTQLISDLQTILRLRCEEKGVQLHFRQIGEVAEVIESDPARLRQILANIIGNSIKFTEQGSVNVTYQVEQDQLVFKVQDTGPGIGSAQRARLFKPFSQGDDSVRKKFGGTGLGLLISKRLAKLLGGDVTLDESILGEGSTFLISIAYRPQASSRTEAASALSRSSIQSAKGLFEGKKILVVEDSLDNQLLAQLYLSRASANVEFAQNGLDGVERVSSGSFDLVLMDIQMPVMDGYTATQELRERGYKLPIIALTGYAMKADQEKCIEAGCTDYLAKPFDRISLMECVARHLEDAAV
jgi:hypothetical protein